MGLKYEMFIMKGTADGFFIKLFEKMSTQFVDTTNLSRREREHYERPIPNVKTVAEFKDAIDPHDPELEAWMKDGGQTGFHIWWMDHPTRKGFVIGGFTTHWMHSADYLSLLCGVLKKCGYEEVVNQSYHHGVNDGHVMKIKLVDSEGVVENYPSIDDEEQKWGKYLKRVQPLCGYPLIALHHYMANVKGMVPWKYTVMTAKPDMPKWRVKHESLAE